MGNRRVNEIRQCKTCGKDFQARRESSKYCSRSCVNKGKKLSKETKEKKSNSMKKVWQDEKFRKLVLEKRIGCNAGDKHWNWGNTKYTPEDLEKWNHYNSKVRYLSDKNYKLYKDIINPDDLPRAGKKWNLDHKYPKVLGFENGVPPEVIADTANLQMLWYKDNLKKFKTPSITLEELHAAILL